MATKALVTGDSRGLGAAIARRLRASGRVVLGLSRSRLDDDSVRIDLSDPDAVAAWLESGVLERFLSDATDVVLVNNAGTVRPVAEAGRQGARAIAAAVALNVTAALTLTDAVLRERPAGVPVRIAHVSSGAGRRPCPGWSVYCATKASLDMHAAALAAEGHEGVRIESIAPGVIDTTMQAEIRAAGEFVLRDRFVELKESGQLSDPDEAARAFVARLESDEFGVGVVTDVRD